jgi:hypothetical protein
MNKATSILLRCLGLNRPKPKTRFGLYLRRSERVLGVLAVLYASLHLFPQMLFAHSVTANGITIYSRSPLPPEAASCAARAADLLKKSELAEPGRQERVFVCDAPWLFRLFSPRSSGAFAVSVPVTDNVFVAAVDFPADVVSRSGSDFNRRSFSSVMAHEITHGLIRHRLGLLRGECLPGWVAEGYCDYVARESSFPETDGFRLFASGQSHPSMSYRYFTYRQMVRYLVENQNLTFSEIVARVDESDAVAAEAREALQSGAPR